MYLTMLAYTVLDRVLVLDVVLTQCMSDIYTVVLCMCCMCNIQVLYLYVQLVVALCPYINTVSTSA